MSTVIEWGKKPVGEPFRFSLHDKPGGMGRRRDFELPNLNSPTLPWDLIPLAMVALQDGPDRLKSGPALAAIHAYLAKNHPDFVDHLTRIGSSASEVFEYVVEEWVKHGQLDPKA